MAFTLPPLTSLRLLVFASFLLGLLLAPTIAHSTEANKPFDPKNVEIHIKHGIELPWGKPGFRIEISGWIPNEAFSIVAIAPGGEKIHLVPTEKPLQADTSGTMTVDIDYERKGLIQGHWILLIAGKPGIHMIQTDLPLVEAPTKSRPEWRLTFGTQNEKKE